MENANKIKDIIQRTYQFAINIIKLVNKFPKTTAAFILGRQLIRSGSSINSNIIHAKSSLTRKEFIYYYNNAKREAKETKSWLQMSVDADLITIHYAQYLLDENEEIIRILVKIVKNSQNLK
ncbi:MAG: four helix bundle protein [Candidatus Parcubacteria bacterium]|nr:four helix bundle protein [Candidatus Parcubacteria bacterium]